MTYWLYYREDGYYDGEHYNGWGDFKCSVCKKDVFIQYDAHEIPSTGELIEWTGKCYCLCNKCISKCMDIGKAKLLENARSYEPHEPKNEEPEWLKEIPSEYKSVGSMLPLVVMFAAIAAEVQKIKKLSKEEQKKAKKKLIKSLLDMELISDKKYAEMEKRSEKFD